jgi:hypothetical protein
LLAVALLDEVVHPLDRGGERRTRLHGSISSLDPTRDPGTEASVTWQIFRGEPATGPRSHRFEAPFEEISELVYGGTNDQWSFASFSVLVVESLNFRVLCAVQRTSTSPSTVMVIWGQPGSE